MNTSTNLEIGILTWGPYDGAPVMVQHGDVWYDIASKVNPHVLHKYSRLGTTSQFLYVGASCNDYDHQAS
jgi:hypothetical protein